MEDFNKLIRDKSDYKQHRDDKFKVDSRDRLSKIIRKKIQTTMIGALSSVEEHFGFLWATDSGELTDEQRYMKETYQKIRSEILDKGNTQARNVDAELAQYDVKWLKYTIEIPVVNNENN
jgi:hypothetical protein|tara:strand:- start:357 stop:716 length:360 start_codon:yes stop_codon:yes gene_type:complete